MSLLTSLCAIRVANVPEVFVKVREKKKKQNKKKKKKKKEIQTESSQTQSEKYVGEEAGLLDQRG